ncbi:MAG: 23S rRNA (pseudouridine(1915)-N(3))-methyltransferase RlmH [Alphaproteobacteria bacterium]|nr:23S rRNA (pseudouridine(1915)-N(3))-methyltransferase RlmH [Alphaproteobacteria bacterium]
MFNIEIIAVARLKKGPYADMGAEYIKRIKWPLTIHEIEARKTTPALAQTEEEQKILKRLTTGATVIALDERGKTLGSQDFAALLGRYRDEGTGTVQFIIGGADGLTPAVRERAHHLLSFGKQTWPHLLARIMLLEQIYRAQQILAGHPYHRE